MKMTKRQKYLVSCLLAILFACFGVGIKTQGASWINRVQSHKTEQAITGKQDHKEVSKTNNSSTAPYSQDQYDQLANLDFQSGGNAILNVNNGQSMLNIDNWKENKVIYGELDPLNRTTFVTAYLDKKNLGRSEGRERQVWKPTGWHQKKVDGKEIGSQDNPKNLATQTAFSNQKVQTYYEKLVRDAQKIKGNKVIYQIVTVFRGKELMPRGYWLQAIDSAGTLNFNVYEYNVQPNVVFNYEDGTSKIERTMKVSWES